MISKTFERFFSRVELYPLLSKVVFFNQLQWYVLSTETLPEPKNVLGQELADIKT